MSENREIDELLARAGVAWREHDEPLPPMRERARARARRTSPSPARLASVAVGGVLVVLVGAAVLFALVTRPHDPVAVVSPSPSPGALVTPSPISSQHAPSASAQAATPAATPSSVGVEGSWKPLGEGAAAWSPDGRYLLVERSDGIDIADASGAIRNSITGVGHALWLDGETVLAYQLSEYPTPAVGDPIATAAALTIDAASGSSAPIDAPCCEARSNGHGAIAVSRALPELTRNVPRYRYALWADGTLRAESDGYALGWSPAGDVLAIVSPFAPTRGASGWLELVSWPSLDELYAAPHDEMTGNPPRFAPSGAFVAYEAISAANETTIEIVDLATRRAATIPEDNLFSWAWNGNGQLVVSAVDQPLLTTYAPDGSELGSATIAQGALVDSSAGGSTLVEYALATEPGDGGQVVSSMSYERNGVKVDVVAPSGSFNSLQMSPDGTAITVSMADGTLLLLELP
jgi:hypothetical protein